MMNVIITQDTLVFKMLLSKDEALLVRWYPDLVLKLLFDILDGVF